MDLIDRVNSFLELRKKIENIDRKLLHQIIEKANSKNPWFTPPFVQHAFAGLLNLLDKEKLEHWLSTYDFRNAASRKVGVVMAGNIPMVGMHDLICVLISGHHLIGKLSSEDEVLIPFIIEMLSEINPELGARVQFVDQLKGMDAVIATGSDNTSRYFDYYFGKYPNIIRKNRTSIAILNGKENKDELEALGNDLFLYFGLGCRNVSKLLIPEGYEIEQLIGHFDKYSYLAEHQKFSNNYQYNKSILLVNLEEHLDNGFAIFQRNAKLVSPLSVIYYDFYSNENDLKAQLEKENQKIQCIISNCEQFEGRIRFGSAQMPDIWDYADNVDTMEFLLSL